MVTAVSDPVGVFDVQFDADTGWATARARRDEVLARWRTQGRLCVLRGCDTRAVDRLCRAHLDKISRRWLPVYATDGELLCGLCRTPIMRLHRNDQARTEPWILEAGAHPDGTCRVEEGGFTVLTGDEAHRHRSWTEAPPLFRAHPPVCTEILRLTQTGAIGSLGGDGEGPADRQDR